MGDDAGIGEVQSYFQNMDRSLLASDPLLSILKAMEIDATLAAAANGSYYTYWNVEKSAELNNTIDALPNPPKKLSDIFKGSRQPRLRGNKIGQAIFDQLKELMQRGGGSGGAGSGGSGTSANSAPFHQEDPVDHGPAAGSSGLQGVEGNSLNSSFRADTPDEGIKLPTVRTIAIGNGGFRRFHFSPDLPPDCHLRVRATPALESEPLGVVKNGHEVIGIGEYGDWIHVQIDGSPQHDAWVLSRTDDGKQLLVPIDDEVDQSQQPELSIAAPGVAMTAASSSAPSVEEVLSSTHNALSMSQAVQAHNATTPARLNSAPATTGSPHAMRGAYAAQPMSLTQLMAQHPTSAAHGDFVPYPLFQQLEQRVLTLEHQLDTVLRAMRSV